MRLFMLWHYYPPYLEDFQRRHPEWSGLEYLEQNRRLLDHRFGWPGALSRHFAAKGDDVHFVVVNAEPMQKQWAREHDLAYDENRWQEEIALAQIRDFAPDVLWSSPFFPVAGGFFAAARPHCGRLAAWVGVRPPDGARVEGFDMLITSHRRLVKAIESQFERTVVVKPAFDATILDDLGDVGKTASLTFFGHLTPRHKRRLAALSRLIREGMEVSVYCASFFDPPPSRAGLLKEAAWELVRERNAGAACRTVRRAFRPPEVERDLRAVLPVCHPALYGMDMYRGMAASRLTLNVHLDDVTHEVGNMRMFEAAGVGTCQVTERLPNIETLFAPGRELLDFASLDELVAVVRSALGDPDRCEAIGAAAQRKALASHTLERMWEVLSEAFAA